MEKSLPTLLQAHSPINTKEDEARVHCEILVGQAM